MMQVHDTVDLVIYNFIITAIAVFGCFVLAVLLMNYNQIYSCHSIFTILTVISFIFTVKLISFLYH